MGKALEVLDHLDTQYKDNSEVKSAQLINDFIRTGNYEGNLKNQGPIKLSGLRYGKPATVEEMCLIFKVIIRTASQAAPLDSMENAAQRIQALITAASDKHNPKREHARVDAEHQWVVLIVSTLAHWQQTVHVRHIVNNTVTTLQKLKIVGNKALEDLIYSIWVSAPYRKAYAKVIQDQETAISFGNAYNAYGSKAPAGSKAFDYFKQAADTYTHVANQGNRRARYLLGVLYAKGPGLIKEGPKHENIVAIYQLLQAARQGVTEAVFKLETMTKASVNAAAEFALSTIYSNTIFKKH
jgi:hypothetical protein